MFKTRITELFGIEYPIIAGPLAYLSQAELVSAVSNAGGLGILVSVTHPTAKDFREEIRKTKSMTDKSFAVNVTLAPTIRETNYEEYFTAAIEEGGDVVVYLAVPTEEVLRLAGPGAALVAGRLGGFEREVELILVEHDELRGEAAGLLFQHVPAQPVNLVMSADHEVELEVGFVSARRSFHVVIRPVPA